VTRKAKIVAHAGVRKYERTATIRLATVSQEGMSSTLAISLGEPLIKAIDAYAAEMSGKIDGIHVTRAAATRHILADWLNERGKRTGK
jgi:hypothetical protein